MPANSNDYFTKLGTFNVSPTRKVSGELGWHGEDSYLYVGDDVEFESLRSIGCINGYLHDLRKVSLIDCIPVSGTGSTYKSGEAFHYVRYFPHYIITGKSHFEVAGNNIEEFWFVIEDFSALFHDSEAFSTHVDKSNIVSEIVKNQKSRYEVKVGDEPIIAYWTGNHIVTELETVLGTITVTHQPSFNSGGPSGVKIDNSIIISIKPSSSINFKTTTRHILDLLRFFEVVIGRPQKITNFVLKASGNSDDNPKYFDVYWSLAPAHNRSTRLDKNEPSYHDVLVDPIKKENEFKTILAKWLELNNDRRSARTRFSNCFRHGDDYDVDRLISAANMFDILPSSAVPKDEELTSDLLEAKNKCISIFSSLPNSPERNSVLGALGRVGKCTLKHKIRYRLEYITRSIGNHFEDIALVADEAVNCRNYFVHGTKTKLDYNGIDSSSSFLTDTLEFIFAISELVEAGWNISEWLNKYTTQSHPFARYKVRYTEELLELKKQLGP